MKKISRRNFLLASGVVTIGAALTACGGSSSTSTAASSTASSAAASEAPAAGGKTLNIWCWNDEFQSRFNDYYPEVAEIAADKSTTTLKDGTIVKWTINPNDNNNYQNKLDEGLLNQESAADDDKIDIFLVEADYALKYVDSDYTLDVKADIGLTDADLAQQYQYTKDIVSVDGSQRGTTWQATPGLFAYRRSIAKEVLEPQGCRLKGVRIDSGDIAYVTAAARLLSQDFCMLSGNDDEVLPLLALGGSGVISVLANIAPDQTHELVSSYQSGDIAHARDVQLKYLELIHALFAETSPAPLKEAMNLLGMKVGSCRLPLGPVSESTRQRLEKALTILK